MQDLDAIPAFLRLTPEERKAAWERSPPKPLNVLLAAQRDGGEPRPDLREEQAPLRSRKSHGRIAKLKAQKADAAARKAGKRWDTRKGRWVKAPAPA